MAPLKNFDFYSTFWCKTAFWQYISKCKLDATFDSAIPGIHFKERKTKYTKLYVQKNINITFSLITAKNWEEPENHYYRNSFLNCGMFIQRNICIHLKKCVIHTY